MAKQTDFSCQMQFINISYTGSQLKLPLQTEASPFFPHAECHSLYKQPMTSRANTVRIPLSPIN